MLKVCNVCKLSKSYDQYAKRSASKDGLNYTCRSCASERNRKWRESNPDGYSDWVKNNVDRKRQSWENWIAKNKSRHAENYARWSNQNRHRVYARNADRVAAKLRATPCWADKERIQSFYRKAVELTAETGVRHEVDHYYPLRGKLVCGLHCPENLRVITRSENARKKNRMPEVCL